MNVWKRMGDVSWSVTTLRADTCVTVNPASRGTTSEDYADVSENREKVNGIV